MQKIITLFQRNNDGDRLVRNEVTPGAEWVINGEGVATKKYDGTCCLIEDYELYKRYDAKKGKTLPEGFIPAQELDPVTGHWPGWLKVDPNNPADKWHVEALEWIKEEGFYKNIFMDDGTYELVGPKINGNKHNFPFHRLIKHGADKIGAYHEGMEDVSLMISPQGTYWHLDREFPRNYEEIKKTLYQYNHNQNIHSDYIEGVVWHHPDGRMVKIKYKDFYKKG